MTTRTRYFVIASLLVLFIGVGTGLVAYYVGFPAGIFSRADEIADLQLLPREAQLVAYADVRDVMGSELRQKVRKALPIAGAGQQEIAERTGINVETDIDQVLACLAPPQGDQTLPAATLILARGRFDTGRIEALMRQSGGQVEEYKGVRLVVAATGPKASDSFAVAFLEPGRMAFGHRSLIRAAIDQKDGGAGLTQNADLMRLLRSVDAGDVWTVGRFDALASQARLPAGLASQMPPITWFAASADVDTGLRGTVRADTRDEEAAANLRELIRGFMALARLQTGSQPELKAFLDSVVLSGTGVTVSVAFNVPPQLVDALGSAAGMMQKQPNLPRK